MLAFASEKADAHQKRQQVDWPRRGRLDSRSQTGSAAQNGRPAVDEYAPPRYARRQFVQGSIPGLGARATANDDQRAVRTRRTRALAFIPT
jgi:hypothetical protein